MNRIFYFKLRLCSIIDCPLEMSKRKEYIDCPSNFIMDQKNKFNTAYKLVKMHSISIHIKVTRKICQVQVEVDTLHQDHKRICIEC